MSAATSHPCCPHCGSFLSPTTSSGLKPWICNRCRVLFDDDCYSPSPAQKTLSPVGPLSSNIPPTHLCLTSRVDSQELALSIIRLAWQDFRRKGFSDGELQAFLCGESEISRFWFSVAEIPPLSRHSLEKYITLRISISGGAL